MDETLLLEHSQGIKKLGHKDLDELGGETLELILFDQLVKVGAKELEDEAEMVPVDEGIPEAKDVVGIVGISGFIKLWSTNQ